MNDLECQETYDALQPLLIEAGLDWIVLQVNQHLALGKMTVREVDTLKDSIPTEDEMPLGLPLRFVRGPRTSYPLAIPYESSERLRALIDAVEEAIINTADFEIHIIAAFGTEITFSPDDSDQIDNGSRSITQDSARTRQNAALNLKGVLDQLRSEI